MIEQKLEDLKNYFKKLGSVAVAFSGGVDSTFLMKVAHDVLGDKAIAITSSSSFIPQREIQDCKNFCTGLGISHIVFDFNPLSNPGIESNPKDRCYVCKKSIFQNILQIAKKNNIENVCEGSNLDDLDDYRPGLKAIRELKILSPLCEIGLCKNEIRSLSQKLNLQTWNRPSFACLASRIPYGEKITTEKLKSVEKAEDHLINLGFNQLRVRSHNGIARIEVPKKDFEKILEQSENINNHFKSCGFSYVTMDLQGYRTGSLNEVIKSKQE